MKRPKPKSKPKPKPKRPKSKRPIVRRVVGIKRIRNTERLAEEAKRLADDMARKSDEDRRWWADNNRRQDASFAAMFKQMREFNGREQRLMAAIERAEHAAEVLNRIELGLRSMVVKAIKASETHHED